MYLTQFERDLISGKFDAAIDRINQMTRRQEPSQLQLDKAEPGKALGHPPYRPLEE